ncbi:MAG: flippase [Elusimicrobia bacterium]|nr:flippase [Candidatus Obscuribacterium magneticum]
MKTTTFPKLLHQIGWRVVLDLFSRGSFFLINILVARKLQVNDFGKFVYALSLVQIFYVFTDMGTHLQLIKELGEKRGQNDAVWKPYLDLKILFMSAISVVFLFLFAFLWKWDAPWLLLLALLWMFSNSILDFNQFVCNGLGRMDLARAQMLIQRSLMLVGILGGLFLVPNLYGTLIGLAIGSVTGALLSNIYFQRATQSPYTFSRNLNQWKKILAASVPMAIGGALGAWWLRIGPLFLAWIRDSEAVGNYSAAFRVFEITYIIPASVMALSVPYLSESLKKGLPEFRQGLFKILSGMFFIGLLWGSFLYLFSPFIVLSLFGQKYASAIPVLKILGINGGLVFVNYVLTHLMVVLNRQKTLAIMVAAIFMVSTVCHIVGINLRGPVGAASALLATEILLFIFTASFLLRKFNILTLKDEELTSLEKVPATYEYE